MPAPRKMIPKEDINALIEQRYNNREISEILNISKSTLKKLMVEYHLKTKPKEDKNIGKRFGKLTVIDRAPNSSDSRKVYKCKCDCGNFTEVKAKYLNNGDTRSCGCYEKDFTHYQEKNYKEALKKVGEKYGRLTIINIAMGIKRKAYFMVCKCECGNIVNKTYSQIVKSEFPSCGCYVRELSSKRMTENVLPLFKNNRNKQWYFIKDGVKVLCRSGYEVLYANYLIINKIDFEYEPESFKLDNGKRYTPDFYLIEENRYIEIKGLPYEVVDKGNQKQRIELFRKNHKLDIYYWEDLYRICNLPYKAYTNYRTKAENLKIRVEDYLAKMFYLTY